MSHKERKPKSWLEGWTEAIQQIKLGEKQRIEIIINPELRRWVMKRRKGKLQPITFHQCNIFVTYQIPSGVVKRRRVQLTGFSWMRAQHREGSIKILKVEVPRGGKKWMEGVVRKI